MLELLCVLIFALIFAGITRILREKLLEKGKNPFPIAFLIAVALLALMKFILARF